MEKRSVVVNYYLDIGCGGPGPEREHPSGEYLLSWTRAYVKCFITHVRVHWVENYTQYLHYNIKKYWVFHNTPSGYIDRNVLMKEMMHFKTICGANNINPQVLLYDWHVSHFDKRDIHILLLHHTKTVMIKTGESINEQPNYNGPNLKMKGLYGQSRMNWQRHNGIPKLKTNQRAIVESTSPVTVVPCTISQAPMCLERCQRCFSKAPWVLTITCSLASFTVSYYFFNHAYII